MVIVAQGRRFRFSYKKEFTGYENKMEDVHKLQCDEEGTQEPPEVREQDGKKSHDFSFESLCFGTGEAEG